MPSAPLAPRVLHVHLPPMTAAQAAQMLDLIDALQKVLWEAYADAVLDLAAERDDVEPAPADDPLPPF